MASRSNPEVIESTAGDVAAELARRGIAPTQRVVVSLVADDWLERARAFARPLVRAEGWSDDDIDRLIDAARDEVQPQLR